MKVLSLFCVALSLLLSISPAASTDLPDLRQDFDQLAARCAPGVHPRTMRALVSVESSHNPYAIGVVNGRLDHQPMTFAEALALVHQLDQQGYNFSLGLAQVNRYNLTRLGESYETIFDTCRNLHAGAQVLRECFAKAKGPYGDDQTAVRAALSCYYSGNFTRGFRSESNGPSYVQKVVARAVAADTNAVTVPEILPRAGDQIEKAPMAARLAPATAPAWVTLVGGDPPISAAPTPPPTAPVIDAGHEPPVVVQLAGNVQPSVPASTQVPPKAGVIASSSGQPLNDTSFVQFVGVTP
ncbi:lytic transglycosylase domain-containing protein [Xanthomonas albilineans]|uniref:lytic transglycosylase domain-containing protein n=1 Tax=Xanthomonas albilineans TaxID=29447 RepID=UPI0009B963E2|nr:lytic transglycosylase domain-containing protein [Xanthomonas albilineans]